MFGFFTLVLLAVVALWLVALRRDPGDVDEARAQRLHRRWVIGGGLVLPLLTIIVLLAWGIPLGQRMLPLPLTDREVLRVDVTARQWQWRVRYPDSGVTLENELRIPAGTPVDISVTSEDVIHSFWAPRLGGKIDAIPGRTNVLRLEADEPGRYHGVCAEFCGLEHARMTFTVEAMAAPDFRAWLGRRASSGDAPQKEDEDGG